MSLPFADKNIVVTGGTGALGTGVVTALLERGATCHIPCVEDEVPATPFADNDRVHLVASVNLMAESEVVAYYDSLPSVWGSIHIAGGFAMAPVQETSAKDFTKMWQLNTLTCFLCCREASKRMLEGQHGGRIVNVGARPAVEPCGGMVAYSTSKAAVASLTQSLAEELKPQGILVNAILPSIIDTPANRTAMPDADPTSWPTPAELAEAIAFLASPVNTTTSGTLLPVYGRV